VGVILVELVDWALLFIKSRVEMYFVKKTTMFKQENENNRKIQYEACVVQCVWLSFK
jgi:hypothetical protein